MMLIYDYNILLLNQESTYLEGLRFYLHNFKLGKNKIYLNEKYFLHLTFFYCLIF